jgi:pyruvate formate lyase activating enzyme
MGTPKALVTDIQRAAAHDGPGLRTTVFFKGCSLRCVWCHNPETIRPYPEISLNREKCISCGACLRDMTRCPTGALEILGRWVTLEEVLDAVLRDRAFYRTGGGVTASGGEPSLQWEFVAALFDSLKKEGIHTCLDTCGFGKRSRFLALAERTDLFLWDIKHTDGDEHRRLTGAPLRPILENLRAVDAAGGRTRLRSVIVENVTDAEEHADAVAALATSLRNCEGVDLLPYHPFGIAKAENLGLTRHAACGVS